MAPNRVALVTGASRGLGADISRRLAADGWAVAVNYRAGQAAAEGVVDAIREAGGWPRRSPPMSSTRRP